MARRGKFIKRSLQRITLEFLVNYRACDTSHFQWPRISSQCSGFRRQRMRKHTALLVALSILYVISIAYAGSNDDEAVYGNKDHTKTYDDGKAANERGDDAKKAYDDAKEAYDRGDRTKAFDDGREAYDKGDYVKAYNTFKVLAERGDAKAQYNLGAMYNNGEGVPQDFGQSVKWLRKAALQGNPSGQLCLGLMYEMGLGVQSDFSEALAWYRKAAEQGDARAEVSLSLMYIRGDNVPKDYVKAHMWLNLAAAQGTQAAKKYRDQIARQMTPLEISEAQRLAREWKSKRKGLDSLTAANE